ncbi:MAG: CHAT domain-containing protein [Thermoanaerobaculia bacterium]
MDLKDAFDASGELSAGFTRTLKKTVRAELIAQLFERLMQFDVARRGIAAASLAALLRTRKVIGSMTGLVPFGNADELEAITELIGARAEPPDDYVPLRKSAKPPMMSAPAPMEEMAAPVAMEMDATPSELPRSFFALAEGPSHVVAAVEFSINAGVTKDAPSPDAKPFVLPNAPTAEYDIVMTVQAVGFTLADDVSVFPLRVTHANPYPTTEIWLTPDVVNDRTERAITIFYSVEGQVIGSGELKVVVHTEEDDETRSAVRDTLRRMFAAPTAKVPPDLTVMITEDGEGQFAWSFISPHDVAVPNQPIHQTMKSNARAFAAQVMKSGNGLEGSPGLYAQLVGLGKDIQSIMPPSFWAILKNVIAKTKEPSLLILSNEPYIPWELATFPKEMKRPYPALAPFLGAQVRVGRWINGNRLPPPYSHTIARASVVSGVYARVRWNRLVKAEEEAAEITKTYNATAVEATLANILGLFDTAPPADLLHFSMHGQSNEEGLEDGLIPIDTGAVKPQMIAGAIESSTQEVAPFVFLNACQVGAGSRILGDYGGMAAAFIEGGAAGVVAPLWSIKDDLAKQIAIDFYKATLEDKVPPAEAIRRARASFVSSKNPVSATYLAYQFFGHPSLQLDGSAIQKKES